MTRTAALKLTPLIRHVLLQAVQITDPRSQISDLSPERQLKLLNIR